MFVEWNMRDQTHKNKHTHIHTHTHTHTHKYTHTHTHTHTHSLTHTHTHTQQLRRNVECRSKLAGCSPFQGEILWNGRVLRGSDNQYRESCGLLQQLSTPYYDNLTVHENLFFCALMRMGRSTTLEDKLERVQAVLSDVSLNTLKMIETKHLSSNNIGSASHKKN